MLEKRKNKMITYKNKELFVENIRAAEIAGQYGTPVYVTSANKVRKRYQEYVDGLGELANRALICYAVKAYGNQAIIELLKNCGAGADLTTGGELKRALAAGVDPAKIVFSGIGKSMEDIESALKAGIRQINVESSSELSMVNKVAGALGKKANICFRLNPQLDTMNREVQEKSIVTGKPDSKFGIPWPVIQKHLPDFKENFPNLNLDGISIHIGSNMQMAEYDQFEITFDLIKNEYIPALLNAGFNIRTLDIGGGAGVLDQAPMEEDNKLIAALCQRVRTYLGPLLEEHPEMTLVMEPGRSLVSDATVLLTKVTLIKDDIAAQRNIPEQEYEPSINARFVVVDASQNHMLRPALYGAFHLIQPVVESHLPRNEWWNQVDICGTVCETTDSFMRPVEAALGLTSLNMPVDEGKRLLARLNDPQESKTLLRCDNTYPEQPPSYSINNDMMTFGYFMRRQFPPVESGDLLAIMNAGAYASSMSAQYNAQAFCAEILVDGDQTGVIKPRQSVEDIINSERVPEWLK